MNHGDRSRGPDGGTERGATGAGPDFARDDLERDERLAELDEPNFATRDIDPAEPDPIPAGRPSFATTDIDPDEVDPIDPDQPNYATKDQPLE